MRPINNRPWFAYSGYKSAMDRFYRWRCFRLIGTATRLVVLDKAMSEIQYSSPANADALDSAERQIAAKYMRMVPWGAVAWAFSNLAVWLSLWPLVLFEIMPLGSDLLSHR